jgi:hypothetical protein
VGVAVGVGVGVGVAVGVGVGVGVNGLQRRPTGDMSSVLFDMLGSGASPDSPTVNALLNWLMWRHVIANVRFTATSVLTGSERLISR